MEITGDGLIRIPKPYGSMYPSSIYFDLKVVSLYRHFGAKVYTSWVHGPFREITEATSEPLKPGARNPHPARPAA